MPQNNELTLYAYTFPSRAERVMWMLKELDLDFTLVRLDPSKGETQTPDFKSIAPLKKIPVLTHGEMIFTESLAIMEYLNGLKPEKKLIPIAPESIYLFRNIMYYMVSEIETYLWLCSQSSTLKQFYPWPEGTFEQSLTLLNQNIQTLFEKVGDKTFLLYDRFTMADIYAQSILSWAKTLEVSIPGNVQNYMKNLMARPAFIVSEN